ncbi:MAG: hypothetical protein PUH57_04535 [Prevotellaceae bacterium]|nr:hypothetical protein [Prevotellaceae bacterium]MDY2750028.1 hypothetical protein [Prevotella sp.]
MKKIFTLIAATLMAANISAQDLTSQLDVFALAEENTIPSGSSLSNSEISVQFGGTISGENDFSAPAKNGSCESIGATGYTAGNGGNPKDGVEVNTGVGYSKETGNLPNTGTFYVVTPAFNGTLEVGVVLNANKTIYVVDAAEPTTAVVEDKPAAKYYGTYSFSVTAGHKYYVFCTGSKLGFYGAQLTYKAGDNVDAVEDVKASNDAAATKALKAVKGGRIVIIRADAEYSVSGAQLK